MDGPLIYTRARGKNLPILTPPLGCAIIHLQSQLTLYHGGQIMRYMLFVFAIFALIISAVVANAGEVTVAWDPNSEADLSGYKLYQYLSPGGQADPVTVTEVLAPATQVTVTGPPEGETHYFSVTAFDVAGNESGFSNEVFYLEPDVPPADPTGCFIVSSDGN